MTAQDRLAHFKSPHVRWDAQLWETIFGEDIWSSLSTQGSAQQPSLSWVKEKINLLPEKNQDLKKNLEWLTVCQSVMLSVSSSKQDIAALTPEQYPTLSDIESVQKYFEHWVAHNKQKITRPFSVERLKVDWSSEWIETQQNDKIEEYMFLHALYPRQFPLIELIKIIEEVCPPPETEGVTLSSIEPQKKSLKIKPAKDRWGFSEKQKNDGEMFKQWLEEIRQYSPLPAIQMEKLNEKIKQSSVQYKGLDEASLNYWFEDIAYPGLCTLDLDTLKGIMEIWPHHTNPTLNIPWYSMEQNTFWKPLRALKNPERSFILNEFLPVMIDGSSWSFEMRFKTLKAMVEKVKDHDWLFEERVRLWCRWGGDLDIKGPAFGSRQENSSAINLFAGPLEESPREWLEKQNNDVWNKVLLKSFPSGSSRVSLKR